jgi:HD domain
VVTSIRFFGNRLVKPSKLRRQIAWVAASLIRQRPDLLRSEARRLAAERLCPGGVRIHDVPSDEEVGAQLQAQHLATRTLQWEERFTHYAELLRPLAEVRQDPERHPEGDVLYHSLQVFELACDRADYDEELLTAALLHDVGRAIDRRDHVAAGLKALEGLVTPRTAWLIENLPPAQELAAGTLGARAQRRLESSEGFEELTVLAECDRQGRVRGARVRDLEDAIDYIRELHCGH